MMSNDEQTEEYEDIFYIFTFEEDSKDVKISNVKRKDNFEFGIFSCSEYRKAILEFLIHISGTELWQRILLPLPLNESRKT